MGHISEPKGIDLQINSGKVTKEDIKEISDFIAKRKAKKKKGSRRKVKTVKKEYAE